MIEIGDLVQIESTPFDPNHGRVGQVIRARHNYFGSDYLVKIPGNPRPRRKYYPRRQLIKAYVYERS